MTTRGDAYAIATAIYPLTDDASERLYTVVGAMFDHSDEAKADLYAQLEERLGPDTTFEDAVLVIDAALDNTRKHFG